MRSRIKGSAKTELSGFSFEMFQCSQNTIITTFLLNDVNLKMASASLDQA